jgi:hypothetical protein
MKGMDYNNHELEARFPLFAYGEGLIGSSSTHNSPTRNELVDTEAVEKAGHVVEPDNETQLPIAGVATESSDSSTALVLDFC